MIPSSNKVQGWVFAAAGGLFAAIGLLMLAIQLFTGEWLFENEGGGPKVPMGFEFAFVFFSFGQVFLFVGLSQSASTPRRRVISAGLAGGNGVATACGFGAIMASVVGWADVDLLLPVWILCLFGARLIVTWLR